MGTAGGTARWRGMALAAAVLAGAFAASACEPLDDAQPPVASVNFEPRLEVSVGPGGFVAETGSREGARVDGPDEATVPKGSVVDLQNTGTDDRRVMITRAVLEGTEPDEADVWLDTGTMAPGDTTVLGLTAIGTYRFADTTEGADTAVLTVHVVD